MPAAKIAVRCWFQSAAYSANQLSANGNATPSPLSGARYREDISDWMRGLLGDSTAFRQPLLAFGPARGSFATGGGPPPGRRGGGLAGRSLGLGPHSAGFRLCRAGFSLT